MSGLVKNFNIWIYSDTIDVIDVRLMVLLIKLYLFIPLSVTLTYFRVTPMSNSFN